jgi:ankyrin repeat protein
MPALGFLEIAKKGDLAPLKDFVTESELDIFELVKQHDVQNFTILHIAAKYGHDDIFNWLLTHDIDLNLTTVAGDTPLILASQYGFLKLIKIVFRYLTISWWNMALI